MIQGTAVTIYFLASLMGKIMSLISTPVSGVLMGYLTKYNGKITIGIFNHLCMLSIVVTLTATLVCTIASNIIIPFLYPGNYMLVKKYFIIANLAQILFFEASVVTVVLLRFAKISYQLYINMLYLSAFIVICIPSTFYYGIWGFSYAMLFICGFRLLFSLILLYLNIDR